MSYLKRKRLILFLLVNETSYMKYRRSSHSDNRIPPFRRTRPLYFTYEGARIDGISRNSEYAVYHLVPGSLIMGPKDPELGSRTVMMIINLRNY